jgi:hypothetical protein
MTVIRDKELTCRSAHSCEWCAQCIEKGERCHSRTHVWDDRLMTGHSHFDCWTAMTTSIENAGELEWTPGDFARGEVYA